MIQVLLRPGALVEHGRAFRGRQTVDDEPERLARRVRVDRPDAMNHPRRIIIPESESLLLRHLRAAPARGPSLSNGEILAAARAAAGRARARARGPGRSTGRGLD